MAESATAEFSRQLYRQVMSDGRLEDPATADLVPRFYDPDVHVRQMSAIAGTAGAFHGYAGLVQSVGEVTREFSKFTLRNRLVIRFEVFENPTDAFRAAESTTSAEPVTRTPGS